MTFTWEDVDPKTSTGNNYTFTVNGASFTIPWISLNLSLAREFGTNPDFADSCMKRRTKNAQRHRQLSCHGMANS
jgi:hypothetical protein